MLQYTIWSDLWLTTLLILYYITLVITYLHCVLWNYLIFYKITKLIVTTVIARLLNELAYIANVDVSIPQTLLYILGAVTTDYKYSIRDDFSTNSWTQRNRHRRLNVACIRFLNIWKKQIIRFAFFWEESKDLAGP